MKMNIYLCILLLFFSSLSLSIFRRLFTLFCVENWPHHVYMYIRLIFVYSFFQPKLSPFTLNSQLNCDGKTLFRKIWFIFSSTSVFVNVEKVMLVIFIGLLSKTRTRGHHYGGVCTPVQISFCCKPNTQ